MQPLNLKLGGNVASKTTKQNAASAGRVTCQRLRLMSSVRQRKYWIFSNVLLLNKLF